jgi:hypothetical protein
MKLWELFIATALYANIARRYGLLGNWGMCLAWASYASANVGFIWAAWR